MSGLNKGIFMFKTLILTLLLVSCASSDKPKDLLLTIIHTNDHHGHYLQDDKGQIGMAARSTKLKELRSEF